MVLQTEVYPWTLALRDGTRLVLRPLERRDTAGLLHFFQAIPEEDRYYLKDNVTSPEVIQHWTSGIDFERVIPLIALEGETIAAEGTLHLQTAPARLHIGEIRVVVRPEYRDRGLGGRMMRELADLARDRGLYKVLFELVDRRQQAAIDAAKAMGFSEASVISEAIVDMDGQYQDLVILELPLHEDNLWWHY